MSGPELSRREPKRLLLKGPLRSPDQGAVATTSYTQKVALKDEVSIAKTNSASEVAGGYYIFSENLILVTDADANCQNSKS